MGWGKKQEEPWPGAACWDGRKAADDAVRPRFLNKLGSSSQDLVLRFQRGDASPLWWKCFLGTMLYAPPCTQPGSRAAWLILPTQTTLPTPATCLSSLQGSLRLALRSPPSFHFISSSLLFFFMIFFLPNNVCTISLSITRELIKP